MYWWILFNWFQVRSIEFYVFIFAFFLVHYSNLPTTFLRRYSFLYRSNFVKFKFILVRSIEVRLITFGLFLVYLWSIIQSCLQLSKADIYSCIGHIFSFYFSSDLLKFFSLSLNPFWFFLFHYSKLSRTFCTRYSVSFWSYLSSQKPVAQCCYYYRFFTCVYT